MGLYHFSHLIIFFQYYIKKLIDFYKKYINTVHTMTTRTFLSNSEEKNTNFAMETRILSQFGVTLSDMLWVENNRTQIKLRSKFKFLSSLCLLGCQTLPRSSQNINYHSTGTTRNLFYILASESFESINASFGLSS